MHGAGDATADKTTGDFADCANGYTNASANRTTGDFDDRAVGIRYRRVLGDVHSTQQRFSPR